MQNTLTMPGVASAMRDAQLPLEPTGFALRRAADDLHRMRVTMRREVMLAEREEKLAHAEKRYSRRPSSRMLRLRVQELRAVVEWLQFRADMRGAW